MQLEHFIELKKDDIENFKHWWTNKRKRQPRSYPMVMKPKDWEEAYAEFNKIRPTLDDLDLVA